MWAAAPATASPVAAGRAGRGQAVVLPLTGSVPRVTLTSAPPARAAIPPARAYVLVDVQTGNILAADHEHLRLRPASLTKLLTALIAVAYLKPTAKIPGTRQSVAAYPDDVGMEKGVGWPLGDVLQSLLVMSANDAAYAIAQRVSGTLPSFGPVMERSAAQMGLADRPVFHDPAGLDGTEGVGGGNLVSARDLAIIGRDFLRVPRLAKIVKETSYSFVDPTGVRHDLATTNYAFLVSQPGAIGLKTGFTDRAGSCVMGAATEHGRTMLAVVLNGYNPTATAMDLLDQGFATPVSKEAAVDRLPAFALPRPPGSAAPSAHRRGGGDGRRPSPGARAGTSTKAAAKLKGPAASSTTSSAAAASPTSGRGRTGRGDGAGKTRARHGLAEVMSTWPGLLLLLASGSAAVLALSEYLKLRRLSGAATAPRPARHRAVAWVTTLGGSRRHRDDLVASYARHERR